MLVCGASFAGLAVARELAGSGARVWCSTATSWESADLGLRRADGLA